MTVDKVTDLSRQFIEESQHERWRFFLEDIR
jgi:hypothetical protein